MTIKGDPRGLGGAFYLLLLLATGWLFMLAGQFVILVKVALRLVTGGKD